MRWPVLVLPAALLLPAARAEEGRLSAPTLSQERGFLVLSAEGRLPQGAPDGLVARVRRGERTALDAPIAREDGGRFRLEVLTARLLLPGRYTLEVAAPDADEALLARDFRTGSEEEAVAARERQVSWLRGAAGALRDLASGLERRGRFHDALAARDPDGAAAQRRRFETWLDAGWTEALIGARMDLATFRRRVLLPHRPDVVEGLEALVPLLKERCDAWREALEARERGQAETPGAPEAILDVGRRLLTGLGRPAMRLAAWRPGPAARPVPAEVSLGEDRVYEDFQGSFRLRVPAGLEPRPAVVRPDERLLLEGPAVKVAVLLGRHPDAETPQDLVAAVEVGNWEAYTSYKRLEGRRLPEDAGVRIVFEADPAELSAAEERVRVVQRTLFDPERRRTWTLLVAGEPDPEVLATLEESFELTE